MESSLLRLCGFRFFSFPEFPTNVFYFDNRVVKPLFHSEIKKFFPSLDTFYKFVDRFFPIAEPFGKFRIHKDRILWTLGFILSFV